MSKTKAILIVITVLILGTAVLYFLAGGKAPGGTPILDYLPFGRAPESSTPGGDGLPGGEDAPGGSETPSGDTPPGLGSEIPPFFRLSEAPVAGFAATSTNGEMWVRFVDRATGHVNDVNPKTLEKVKIYNNTTPKIYTAIFRPNASGFIQRQLSEGGDLLINRALMLETPKSTSTDGLLTAKSSSLPGNIGDILINTDGSLLYNLTDTGDVIASPFAGDKPKVVFNSSFTEWRLGPLTKDAALLFTKPSASSVGFAYSLNLSSGSLSRILGPLSGLSVKASPDGRRFLYSYLDDSGKNMFTAMSLNTGLSLDIYPVTLPEKCVWSKKISAVIICGVPDGGLGQNAPDEWYLGLAHYEDKIWRFNVNTDTAEELLDPKKTYNQKIDVMNPELSSDESYLYLINKNDLSLWALKLLP